MGSAFPTFEGYAGHMQPVIAGLARRYSRTPHPFLGQADLEQECLLGLWQVWTRYREQPADDLCRLGTRTALNKLHDTWLRTQYRGHGEAHTVSLDALPVDVEDLTAHADFADLYLMFALGEIERMLSEVDQAVLRELLLPGVRTLAVIRALLREKRGWREHGLDVASLSRSLERPPQAIEASWVRVQHAARGWFAQATGTSQPITGTGKEVPMPKSSLDPTQGLPDADALGLGDPEPAGAMPFTPVKEAAMPAAAIKKVPPKKKAPSKAPSKGAKKAPAKAKPPMPKPAAAKVVREEKPGVLLPVGTKVRYLGGSRASWLKPGAEGVIRSRQYEIKFPEKLTTLAARFIEKG